METTEGLQLPSDYLLILIQFAAALGFVLFAIITTHLIEIGRAHVWTPVTL